MLGAMPGYIDAHVHVWTDDFLRYPLAPPHKPAEMAAPSYRPEAILETAGRHGVDRVVLVQMSYYGSDNSYMLDTIERHAGRFRGIAIIDENSAGAPTLMRQLKARGVRGFRVTATRPDAAPGGRAGLKIMLAAGERDNLALAFLTGPEFLPDIDRLCERFPHAPVIIDHMARIGMTGEIRERDVELLCRLARHRRTMVKVSAFYALGAKRPPYQDLAPLIRRLYDSFGPRRLMWASDSPFQVLQGQYGDSIALIRDGLPFLSPEDKEWILRRTAEEFFFQ